MGFELGHALRRDEEEVDAFFPTRMFADHRQGDGRVGVALSAKAGLVGSDDQGAGGGSPVPISSWLGAREGDPPWTFTGEGELVDEQAVFFCIGRNLDLGDKAVLVPVGDDRGVDVGVAADSEK